VLRQPSGFLQPSSICTCAFFFFLCQNFNIYLKNVYLYCVHSYICMKNRNLYALILWLSFFGRINLLLGALLLGYFCVKRDLDSPAEGFKYPCFLAQTLLFACIKHPTIFVCLPLNVLFLLTELHESLSFSPCTMSVLY